MSQEIENILHKKNIPYYAKGNDYLVKCFNPEHDDSNPSMRIDQVTGIFNCFSCGFKGNLFHHFGERANQLQLQREKLKKVIRRKMSDTVGLQMPAGYAPYKGTWRDIKKETYQKFKAFTHHDNDYVGRVIFPITDVGGKIVAFNGRHMSGGTPKYLITPHKAKLPLFPKVSSINSTIVLVEGIYDVLNLHDKGLTNTCCCFGTNNINEEKLRILSMQGITHINIFFDGDEAGQKGAEKVKELCEAVDLTSTNVYLLDKDPGSLSQTQVDKLKRKLYG